MDTMQLRDVITFENSLKPGQKVRVSWTNSGRYYQAIGEILKCNAQSFIIKLTESMPKSYTVSQSIKVPRLALGGSGFKLWSENNRVQAHLFF